MELLRQDCVAEIPLKHLDLWHLKRKPQPLANGPPTDVCTLDDEPPGPSVDDLPIDP